MKKIILLALLGAVIFAGCKKDDVDEIKDDIITNINYQTIFKDTTDNDLVLTLMAETKNIKVGYTPIYISVKDFDGNRINNADVKISPIMDMGGMEHGCPIIQTSYNSDKKLYEGASIFTMAGEWDFEIEVDGSKVEQTINIGDLPSGIKHVGNYIGADGKDYVVSLVKPVKWKVGMNDFSIMIHEMEDDMIEFTPLDDFTIYFEPEMTSMEHGSPNNISPTNDGNGFYSGKVNFTMTGDWRLNLDLIKNDETIVNASLDIVF